MPSEPAPGDFVARLPFGLEVHPLISLSDRKGAINRVQNNNGVASRSLPHQPGTVRLASIVFDMDTILRAPIVAEPLGVFDCCGVSDGAACAIVTTPDIARALCGPDLVTIKALQLAASSGVLAGTAFNFIATRFVVFRAKHIRR